MKEWLESFGIKEAGDKTLTEAFGVSNEKFKEWMIKMSLVMIMTSSTAKSFKDYYNAFIEQEDITDEDEKIVVGMVLILTVTTMNEFMSGRMQRQ